jgi:Eukaryotic DNA topoisomerase I, catalytic core
MRGIRLKTWLALGNQRGRQPGVPVADDGVTQVAAGLPDARSRLGRPRGSALPREKVLATVVHLLETTLIRVGNDDYAKQNNSYGLTTLKNRHVLVDGNEVRFRFTGKSGKQRLLSSPA